jgi:SAM-dependent methyltransferase
MSITTPQKLSCQAGHEERAVPCPACGGRALSVLLTHADIEAEHGWLQQFYSERAQGSAEALKDRAEFTQSQPTNIVRCVACGTLLRDPQPTPEALAQLYAADSYGQETLQELAANQYEFYRAKAVAMSRYLPRGARILEIGSFVGGFLRSAAEQGWQATGIDIGEETIAFMRAAGYRVLEGDVCELDLPRAAWDGIFIWNTFDQLPEPAPVLERAQKLLKPKKFLVLRVPNGLFEVACLELRHHAAGTERAKRVKIAQAYNNFLTFPYLTGYTPDSIRRLLAAHGFGVLQVKGDTILRLADSKTPPFAAQEERRYKAAVMRLCRRFASPGGEIYCPWIDIIARRV